MIKKIAILLLVIMLMNSLMGCTNNKEAQSSEVEDYIAVSVTEVTKGTVSLSQSYSTRVNAKEEANVFANVQGTVEKVFVEVGNVVAEEDVLFTIDRPDLENQLQEVYKSLELANLNIELLEDALESAKGNANEQQAAQLEQMLINTEIAYTNTKDTYQDTLVLYEQGAVSEQQLIQAKSGLDQAEAAFNVAKLNYDLYINDGAQSNVDRAETQLEQALLQKEQAELSIKTLEDTVEDTKVKSPISGVITSVNVKENQLTGSNTIPVTVVNTETITMNVGVSENLVTKLKVDEKVEVVINAASNDSFTGIIKNISIAADKATSKYNVTIEVDNSEGLIYAGMFAQVRFVTENEKGIVIPVDALLIDDEGEHVYIINGDIPEKRYVATGLNDSHEVIILDGLNVSDILIIEGQHYVKEDSRVRIVE